MKIRYKIWLFIIFIISVTIILINVIANSILVSSYDSLERKNMTINVQRFHNALNNEINQLDAAVGDWSAWNDTYMFVGGENNEFPDNNLDNATLTNLRTDIMIYVNTSGNIIYEKGFDYGDQKIINVSSSLNNYIYKDSFLVNFVDLNSSIKGIIQLPEDPILIASRPIITSDRQGPIRGSVIWGRYLDSDELNFLSTTVNLSASITNFNDQASAPDFRKAALSLTKNGGDIFIQQLDNNYVAGYSKIEDIFGKPVLLIKVTMDRDIYKQGILTIQYFQSLVIILGVILSIDLIFFLDKTLLSRLNNFNKQVLAIGKKSDFSTRIKISGKDELNDLANVTNETLQIIESLNTSLEQKVLERTKKIDILLKQKDDFINQLGHDLKSPLTPLVALLPLIEKQERDPELKKLLGVTTQSTKILKELIRKTLYLARLNALSTAFDMEDTDLFEVSEEVMKNIRFLSDKHNIIVENKIDDDIIVKANGFQLKEVFDNLLTNAIKFSPDGGVVTINAKKENDFIVVSVKDMGIGLTKEELPRIFDEFYKADMSRHDLSSSGLGLSICKRIVEKHGGQIWAESPGERKGTTIYFTLPTIAKPNNENISGKVDKLLKDIDGKKVVLSEEKNIGS